MKLNLKKFRKKIMAGNQRFFGNKFKSRIRRKYRNEKLNFFRNKKNIVLKFEKVVKFAASKEELTFPTQNLICTNRKECLSSLIFNTKNPPTSLKLLECTL